MENDRKAATAPGGNEMSPMDKTYPVDETYPVDDAPHVVGYGTFLRVYAALLVFTALTIYVAGLGLGNWSTFAAVFIASIKASLVLFFFMHLKYERMLFKTMALVCIATLTVIILLTFTDVWYR